MNDVINLLKSHKSVRKYKNMPLEEEKIAAIISSAQAASTSSFMQAYTIIRVNDPKKREKLFSLAGNQSYIIECSLFLVFCADLNKLNIACEMHNYEMAAGYTESFLIAAVDTALAAQNAIVAAESLGLGGVYIGGIRNNPEDVSDLLELPQGVFPLFGMCIGYPDENTDVKERLPLEVACCTDKYDVHKKLDLIKSYDERIQKYYLERTNGLRQDTWSMQMAYLNSKPLRPHIKSSLLKKGFELK